ncbi:MAG TPA: family 1 glycosylhydrolase [Chloroflexota bacterium]|nr:family 1 glycosylhydrolase [Chloroflexota bacterium]
MHDSALAVRATHHLLLAHGYAVPLLRANSPGARVGITLNLSPVEPGGERAEDHAAAQLADVINNRLYLDPLYRGTYPAEAMARFGEDAFGIQAGDMQVIGAPLDFLGVNYYTRAIRVADPGGNPIGEQVQIAGVERTDMGWEVYPEGLYTILERVHREYRPGALYVTENGAAFADEVAPDGQVHDERRQAYLARHFAQAQRLVADGVPLRGYFVWSLLDNFEWAEGYSKRFGIVYVDYATQQRTVKDSGRWYADCIGARTAPLPV